MKNQIILEVGFRITPEQEPKVALKFSDPKRSNKVIMSTEQARAVAKSILDVCAAIDAGAYDNFQQH